MTVKARSPRTRWRISAHWTVTSRCSAGLLAEAFAMCGRRGPKGLMGHRAAATFGSDLVVPASAEVAPQGDERTA